MSAFLEKTTFDPWLSQYNHYGINGLIRWLFRPTFGVQIIFLTALLSFILLSEVDFGVRMLSLLDLKDKKP